MGLTGAAGLGAAVGLTGAAGLGAAVGFFFGLTSGALSSSSETMHFLLAAFAAASLGVAAFRFLSSTGDWRVGESAAKARATTRRSERTQRLDSGPIGCGQQAAPAGRGAMLAEPRCGRGAPCGILALRIINHYLPWGAAAIAVATHLAWCARWTRRHRRILEPGA